MLTGYASHLEYIFYCDTWIFSQRTPMNINEPFATKSLYTRLNIYPIYEFLVVLI